MKLFIENFTVPPLVIKLYSTPNQHEYTLERVCEALYGFRVDRENCGQQRVFVDIQCAFGKIIFLKIKLALMNTHILSFVSRYPVNLLQELFRFKVSSILLITFEKLVNMTFFQEYYLNYLTFST